MWSCPPGRDITITNGLAREQEHEACIMTECTNLLLNRLIINPMIALVSMKYTSFIRLQDWQMKWSICRSDNLVSEGAFESAYHHLLFEGTDIFIQFSNVFSHWILTLHTISQKCD